MPADRARRKNVVAPMRVVNEGRATTPGDEGGHRDVLDSLKEVVFQTDPVGNWTFLNNAWTEITGFGLEETLGTNFLEYVHPDEVEGTLSSFAAVVSGETDQCHHEGRYRTAHGGWRWVELRVGLMFDNAGRVTGNAGTIFDITDRHIAQELLSEQTHVLELVARDAPLVETLQSLAGLIAQRSGGVVGISGSPEPEAAASHRIRGGELSTPGGGSPGREWFLAVTEGGSTEVGLSRIELDDLARANGLTGHLELPITSTASKTVLGKFMIYHHGPDILEDLESVLIHRCTDLAAIAIERVRAREDAKHQANHDPLTGLPNRTVMVDRLQRALTVAQRNGTPAAVLLADIDHFKLVNDTLGHDAGDEALRHIGARMNRALRDVDTVCRLGGDEFVVVLPQLAQAADAERVASKLLRALEHPLSLSGEIVRLSASIGIALYSGFGDARALLKQADVAMYRAKRFRGSHAVYEAASDEDRLTGLGVAAELRHAIESDQLVLHYQPKVDLRTGRASGVEALVRWCHPERGLMLPAQFIPVAETTGLIVPLSLWVLHNAIADACSWSEELDVPVQVNLSTHVLHDVELPGAIEQTLASCALSPEHLELEVTESAVMADPEGAIRAMTKLSSAGVSFALDDFGTGYSSLAYLKRLPVSVLKIDSSFVSDLAVDERDASIVSSAVDLAHNLEIEVVGEGVESRRVCLLLRELGCDHAQGYYLASPMPASEIRGWLLAHLDADPFKELGLNPTALP